MKKLLFIAMAVLTPFLFLAAVIGPPQPGGGTVTYSSFRTTQFSTNGGIVTLKSGAVATNVYIFNAAKPITSSTIDFASSDEYTNTLSADTAFTFANFRDSMVHVVLNLNGFSPTFPAGLTWRPSLPEARTSGTEHYWFEPRGGLTNAWHDQIPVLVVGDMLVAVGTNTWARVPKGATPGLFLTEGTNGVKYWSAGGAVGDFIDEVDGTGSNLAITADSTTDIPLKVTGFSATLTNLFQVRNSGGTDLFSIAPNNHTQIGASAFDTFADANSQLRVTRSDLAVNTDAILRLNGTRTVQTATQYGLEITDTTPVTVLTQGGTQIGFRINQVHSSSNKPTGMIGFQADPTLTLGNSNTFATYSGFKSGGSANAAQVSDWRSFEVVNPSSSSGGGPTTLYGLYIPELTSNFATWAIYNAGTDKIRSFGDIENKVGTSTNFARMGGTFMGYNTSTGNATTVETALISTNAIPANTFLVNNQQVEAQAWGTFAANANVKQIKIYFGTTTIFDSGALVLNGGSWSLTATVVRTGTSGQTCRVVFNSSNSALSSTVSVTAGAETSANSLAFYPTGTGVATDDILLKFWAQEFKAASPQ